MFDFWGQRYEKAREMQKKSRFLFISERKYPFPSKLARSTSGRLHGKNP